mgnify:CR=1 FL=1
MVKQKKAAVEMSLNLIIMLIIGIVVLGLVIGFVNNLVSQGEETYTSQLNDNEQLKLEEVSRCPENLCMIPSPGITLSKGDTENVFLKVRAFDTDISVTAGPLPIVSGSDPVGYEVIDSSGTALTSAPGSGDAIFLAGPGFNAVSGESDAKMYALNIENGVPIGTYYLTLSLYPTTPNEVETTLTINVE